MKIKNSLFLKIALIILVINIPIIIALFFSINIWPFVLSSLFLSISALALVFRILSPLRDVAKKIFTILNKDNKSGEIKGGEIEVVQKSLDLLNQNIKYTYANIAYERDVLSSQKNKLATIVNSISDGLIVVDIHRKILLANPAAEKIIGYSEKEMLGQDLDKIILVSSKGNIDIPVTEYCPVNLSISDIPKFYNSKETVTVLGKNQKKSEIRISGNSVSGSVLADLGCVLILHDITRESSLATMQVDFVSMASHELRTPLTSIVGYLSVLADEAKDKLSNEQNDFLDKALTATKQLQGLINNLLNVSKVERGAIAINAQALDWNKVLSLAVDENKLQAVQKNINVEFIAPPTELPKVSADNVRIMEVLNNLIGNAVNYTNEGGSIKVSAKLDGDEVITSITDNGKGIPKDAIPHLFTKFFRVSSAQDKSANSKGTGLGLFLSKSIIDLHKGRIWVESEVGKGTTFFFSLPVAIKQATDSDILSKLGIPSSGLTTHTKPNNL